jgi:hypothetical protein
MQFVHEYLLDLNITQAAYRAKIGSTLNTARVVGSELFHTRHVARAIDMALTEDASGPRAWLLNRLAEITNANVDDFFDWLDVTTDNITHGVITLKAGSKVPRELRRCIKGIEIKKGGQVKITLHDPVRAAEIMAQVRSIALTAQQHEHKHTVGLDQLLGSYSTPEPAQVAAPDPMKQIASAIDAEFEEGKR